MSAISCLGYHAPRASHFLTSLKLPRRGGMSVDGRWCYQAIYLGQGYKKLTFNMEQNLGGASVLIQPVK